MPKYVEKICNMLTLLKYAKIRQSAKYAAIAYSHFSDMPRQYVCSGHTRNIQTTSNRY